MTTLDKRTLVPIGLVVSVIVAVVGGAWVVNDAKHAIELKLVQIDTRLEGIQKEMFSRTNDRWRETDMVHWAELLKAENKEMTVPVPRAAIREVD